MTNLYPFLLYAIVTTFTPGPNNIMAMSNAMRFGYKRTLGFLAGMFTGFSILMLICGLVNTALMSLLPHLRFWFNILGAIYMIYLAVHTLRSRPIQDTRAQTGTNSFMAGAALQFLNVKVILYGITIFSMFITPSFQNPFDVSLFAPLLAGLGFISASCWAFGGSFFREFWQKHYRAFNLTMAALLTFTAIHSLFFSG